MSLRALNSYSEESHQWKQAHTSSAFAILKACIKWGNGCISFIKKDKEFKLILDNNKLENIIEAIKKSGILIICKEQLWVNDCLPISEIPSFRTASDNSLQL